MSSPFLGKMDRTAHVVTLMLTLTLMLGCSSQVKLEKKGDESYKIGEFNKAADLYERSIEKTKNEVKLSERLFKAANCYRLMNVPKKAAKYYQKSIRKKNRNPLLFLYIADQKRKLGLYDEAQPFYEQFKQMQPDDKRGDIGIASCKQAREWLVQPTRYTLDPMKTINSKANDFCPSYANDDYTMLYFTTSREMENSKKINPSSGMVFTNIISSRQERTGTWNDPLPLEDTTINSQWDDGATAFSRDHNTMYFTTCKREQGKNIGCQIYESQSRGGEWGKTARVRLISDTLNIGHPSLSADGLQLYFAADLPGGFGGTTSGCASVNLPAGRGEDLATWGQASTPPARNCTPTPARMATFTSRPTTPLAWAAWTSSGPSRTRTDSGR